METCKTCRWWHKERHEEGLCSAIHTGAGNRKTQARLFPVTTGAYLETTEDFGCTMHEKKS